MPIIHFVGEDGDDYGGPRREFFRLLMLQVTTWGIFEGSTSHFYFLYDQMALSEGRYRVAGKLTAWSILHGGPGLRCLSRQVYEFMCGQEPTQYDWENLPDPEVRSRIQKIQDCKTEEDFWAIKSELGDWLSDCGLSFVYTSGIQDVERIVRGVVKHFAFLRVSNMVTEFTGGMDEVGQLWQCCCENWEAFLPVFTDCQQPMTRAKFRSLLLINYSPIGSNRRDEEEETIYTWELFLNMVDAKDTSVSYEDLLIFITGTDTVPALGFPSKLTVDFFDREDGVRRLPYASTCSLNLFLPRGLSSEEEMADLMLTAVKCGIGFGKP
ncbi:hypothetical protein SKAU_G00280260 [Synaphobranchus kaupii]|uniref:HECT-type E3 ubiquitin transferase n=1 Tax=Synaphobranchus kaupii TaxID=118154 RepID=A0A9Q1EX11_SYNKA|nr:hypothetical protein SKAU_G00280260 [Synaphobranchus kaupii]